LIALSPRLTKAAVLSQMVSFGIYYPWKSKRVAVIYEVGTSRVCSKQRFTPMILIVHINELGFKVTSKTLEIRGFLWQSNYHGGASWV